MQIYPAAQHVYIHVYFVHINGYMYPEKKQLPTPNRRLQTLTGTERTLRTILLVPVLEIQQWYLTQTKVCAHVLEQDACERPHRTKKTLLNTQRRSVFLRFDDALVEPIIQRRACWFNTTPDSRSTSCVFSRSRKCFVSWRGFWWGLVRNEGSEANNWIVT